MTSLAVYLPKDSTQGVVNFAEYILTLLHRLGISPPFIFTCIKSYYCRSRLNDKLHLTIKKPFFRSESSEL